MGAAFPPLQPCWKVGQLAMFSRESEGWIFMYNLLILILATNSRPPLPTLEEYSGNLTSTMVC